MLWFSLEHGSLHQIHALNLGHRIREKRIITSLHLEVCAVRTCIPSTCITEISCRTPPRPLVGKLVQRELLVGGHKQSRRQACLAASPFHTATPTASEIIYSCVQTQPIPFFRPTFLPCDARKKRAKEICDVYQQVSMQRYWAPTS